MIVSKDQEASKIVMEIVTDPVVLAKARAQDERFQRNWEWYEPQIPGVFEKYRGKCICVAGREIFVGDTPKKALDAARAAHPDDDGYFSRIIPRERMIRIYANRRGVAPL